MGLSGRVGIAANFTQTPVTAPDLGSISYPLSYSKNWDVTSGVGANQADQAWVDERTLATAATEDLDLSGTTLQNVFGVNLAFVKVKAILIEALAANTTNLTVGNATTPFLGPFGAGTHTLILKPGDFCCFGSQALAGYPVTAATADLLRVTNAAGASATYRIILVGTTA